MQQGAQAETIRLLILDDHALFRAGISRLLDAQADLSVCAECGSIGEAVTALDQQSADLILLDYDLGEERGSEFVLRLHERRSEVPILVLTAGVDDHQALGLIEEGVSGIFLKTDPPERLVEAIRAVVTGHTWFGDSHRDLVSGPARDPSRVKALSAREQLVLRGVVDGLANKEIGAKLEISESSVKAALQQLFFKTGVRTRSQLVRVALERYREAVL